MTFEIVSIEYLELKFCWGQNDSRCSQRVNFRER